MPYQDLLGANSASGYELVFEGAKTLEESRILSLS